MGKRNKSWRIATPFGAENLYTKMQFSDKALRSAHAEQVRLISDEAEAAIKEASFNLQRQLLGDSSGRIRSTAELYGGNANRRVLRESADYEWRSFKN